jgi:MFS family permease
MRRRTLIGACAPQVAIAMDFAIWAVTGPQVRAALGLSAGDLGWAFSAYALAFGSLLMASGRLADAVGAPRMLRTGAAVFASACVIEALARSGEVLIGARALQGAGAAGMAPAAIALLAAGRPAGQAGRGAMAGYGVAIAAGFSAGTLAAGVLVPLAGWRVSLLPGALVAALGVAALGRVRATTPAPEAPRPRAALLAGVLAAIVVAVLGQLAAHPLLATSGLALALAGAAGAGTAARDRRPDRALAAGGAGALLLTATGTAGVLLVSIRLQEGRGWSALAASAVLAAFGLATWPATRAHRALTARLRPEADVAAGLLLEGAALAALAASATATIALVAAVALLGFAHVVGNAAVAASAVAGPPGGRGGRAGVLTTAEYLGGAIGPVAIGAVPAATAAGYVTGMAGASAIAVAGSLVLLRAGAGSRRAA